MSRVALINYATAPFSYVVANHSRIVEALDSSTITIPLQLIDHSQFPLIDTEATLNSILVFFSSGRPIIMPGNFDQLAKRKCLGPRMMDVLYYAFIPTTKEPRVRTARIDILKFYSEYRNRPDVLTRKHSRLGQNPSQGTV